MNCNEKSNREYCFPRSVLIYLGFELEKSQLPSSIRGRLRKEQVSLDELRRLLDHLRHVCECTEIKMKQFTEAEKDPRSTDEDENINVCLKHLYYKLEVPL
jgi:hypothetical protein